MFFIHFQFKVAFRAPFPSLPPLLLASCGCGETFFVPCPKSVSAMNSNGFAANWQNFLCVFAAKVDHKIVAIAFTYNAPTSRLPLPPLQLQQQTKKVQTNYHTNCDKHTQKFFPTLRGGAEIQQLRKGGRRRCNAYAALSATVSGIAFSRCAADKCEVVFVAAGERD